MKTKPIILILAVLFVYAIAPVTGNAQTETENNVKTSIKVSDKDPKMIIVMISNPNSEKLNLDVYSVEEGNLMHKTVTVNQYQANLDFATAVDGEYNIDITCSRGKIHKTVYIQTKESLAKEAQLK